MPKEVIHPSVPQRIEDGPVRMLEVQWQPDGSVQVAMRTEVYEGENRVIGDVVATDVDRQQINRTIRALRRARDQAYGRDE